MKLIVFAFAFLAVSGAHAADVLCEGGSDRATLRLEQQGANVSIQLKDTPRPFKRSYGDPMPQGFDAEVQQAQTVVVKNTTIAGLRSEYNTLLKLVGLSVMSLNRFGGEEDMIYVYAGEFIAALKCQ